MNQAEEKTILIVDDIDLNREILFMILKDKYHILEANNGMEAKEILEREHERISLILLDIIMPVMNGFEFLKYIQEEQRFQNIPIILVTSETYQQNILEGVRMGVKDVIAKPFSPHIVMNRVNKLILLTENRQNREKGAIFSPSITDLQPKKKSMVLIVDDEELNRTILKGALEGTYEVIEASNGKEAIDQLVRYQKQICIILLDIIMPIMDGIQMMEHTVSFKIFEKIPVIAITSDDSLSRIQRIKELGICEVIYKPFNPYIVKNRVDYMVELYQNA